MSKAKSSAADRTVDLFAPPTKDVVSVAQPLETDDASESKAPGGSIEVSAERWRANAFFTQEHLSKHFNQADQETGKFRITTSKGLPGWLLLERMGLNKGDVYSWTGVMFKESELYEVTGVFVKASKAKQEKDNG